MAIAVDPNSRVYIHQINRLRGGGPPSSTRQCNPNALTMGLALRDDWDDRFLVPAPFSPVR
jgi:hypothetical protein